MRRIVLVFLLLLSYDSTAGYFIHLQRDTPISLEEWQTVVGEEEFVRISEQDAVVFNPVTKEKVKISIPQGSAEVYFPECEEWHLVFTFSRTIYFYAPKNWDQKDMHIRLLVFRLASKLNAKVIGDEGEEYFE